MIRFILKLLLTIGVYVGLQQLIELKTLGFCLQKIRANDLQFQKSWEAAELSQKEKEDVEERLRQPYYLIGAGSECFAFISQDQQSVIKFFKLDLARPVFLHRGIFLEDHSEDAATLSDHPLTHLWLPYPLNQALKRFLGIREFRIQRTFGSIKMAYDELKDETGLLYLHLNPTDHLQKVLSLYDANGICHHIDLDEAKFFLQKRAIPLKEHFVNLKQTGADIEAKQSIDAFISLILKRCKKGFSDRDIACKNFGFIGSSAIEIDSGSFAKNEKMKQSFVYKQELFYGTLDLKMWLKKTYPEMVSYLEQKVTEEIYK